MLSKIAEANFPSRFGHFRIYGFEGAYDGVIEECVVLRMGDVASGRAAAGAHPFAMPDGRRVPQPALRLPRRNSSWRCNLIAEEGRGLLIYEHQEGRGIGLLNKLRAYELQDGGADTVEANERLGFESDLRDYRMPAEILRYFKIKSVRLLSNNPDKIAALENSGIRVAARIPCIIAPHESTEGYLRTKKQKMGHLLD